MTAWRVDAKSSSTLDSRAVIERDALGQWDLPDDRSKRPIVAIESVELYVPVVRKKKRMPDGSYAQEPLNKLKIRFRGKRKFFICNQVNRKILEQLFGTKLQAWIGKKVTLYVDDDVTMGSKRTGGLRIANRRPDGHPTADPLDEAINDVQAAVIAEAKDEFAGDSEREPGEEG